MKFSSKFLKQAGAVVYVLFESDRPITFKNLGNPIGVVSSERVANLFYQQDSTRRNIFEFVLDGLSGPNPPSLESEVDATRKRVEDSTRKMEEFLEEMRNRKK